MAAVAAAAASKTPLAARSADVLRGKLLRRYIFRALTRSRPPSPFSFRQRDGVCLVNFAFFSLFTHIIYGKRGERKNDFMYTRASGQRTEQKDASLLQLVRHAHSKRAKRRFEFFHPRLIIKMSRAQGAFALRRSGERFKMRNMFRTSSDCFLASDERHKCDAKGRANIAS